MSVRVQLEVGSKKVFATAVEWPGWSRSAKDAGAALDALLAYGARYKRAMGAAAKALTVPKTLRGFEVIGKVKGDSGTDFGVPSKPLPDDDRPVTPAELRKLVALLEAAWRAFDRAAGKAKGATLAKGPRGGGRTLAKMRAHLVEADHAYLRMIGGTAPDGVDAETLRAETIDALRARARGELPDTGPRGGTRWTVRTAVHRSAWHALDHAWEIEDRS